MDWNQTAWMVANVGVCLLIVWASVLLLRAVRRPINAAIAEYIESRETDAYDAGYRAGLEDSEPPSSAS